ncbi:MAG: hypothetical protein LBQ26_01005, partial [Holosporales bacterium]|nr:hypothetical protein [Holosporales bacterium]
MHQAMQKTFDDFLHRLVRRRRLFFVGEICAFVLIFIRLAFLQLAEDERYNLLSQRNCVRLIPILPQRGDICDRNGKILATNAGSYRLFLENPVKTRLEQVLELLRQELALPETKIASLRTESLKAPHLTLMLACDNLSWEKVSLLAFHQSTWPELCIALGHTRTYPYGE